MQEDIRAALVGACGGTIGSLPMGLCMRAARRLGLLPAEPLPPQRITRGLAERAGVALPEGPVRAGTEAMAHYGFGAAAGALFGVGYHRLHLPLPGPLQGAAFGIAVWASSYAGWVPGLSILPAPPRDEKRRPPAMIAVHLVYGTLLGALLDVDARRPS